MTITFDCVICIICDIIIFTPWPSVGDWRCL